MALAVGGAASCRRAELDITALRLGGADASAFLASLVGLPLRRALGADHERLWRQRYRSCARHPGGRATYGDDLRCHRLRVHPTAPAPQVPITAYVSGDTVVLIRTADEPARDEVLAALP